MNEIVLDVPFPPSTNHIWRHSRGHVYLSKEYEAWMSDAGWAVMANRQMPKERITGPFEIRIYLARKNEHGLNHRGDGDNRIKPVLDWLQPPRKKKDKRIGIIEDDKHCQRGTWEWVPRSGAPMGCRVFLRLL